ncbi:MAG: glycerol-3-phosphate acyltransferase [Anaerolineae bacterium]|nr:glycerol-3-phosphate acyltransferase [Anaerolineae bacterium]
MQVVIWTLLAFFFGAVPFSLLVGRYALRTDIRAVGDGNPGATNVLRSGGRAWAAVALLLDMLKGALPAALAYAVFGWRSWECLPIALAPLLGHSFSPFLRGKGGKGVAVTGGVWIGLTYGVATAVGALFLTAGYAVGDNSGWAVAAGLAGIGGYLALFRRDPVLLVIWFFHTLLVLWRYRAELRQRPRMRAWLRRK